MKRAAFVIAGLASIVPWLAIVFLTEPAYVNIDESIYQRTAERMSALKQDAYSAGAVNRPPLVFTVYRAASWLPFAGTRSYHVLGIAFRLALALCVAALAERRFGHGYFGPTFFFALAGHWVDGQFWSVNAEMLAAPFVAAAVLILFARERRIDHWQAFVGGLLIGIAALFKQTCLAMLLVGPAVFFGAAQEETGVKPTLVRLSALWITGALLPIVAAFLWFYSGSSWNDFVFWTLKADAGYVFGGDISLSHWLVHPYRIARWTLEWSGTGFGFALIALLFWLSSKRSSSDGSMNFWMFWGWLIACFVAIMAGRRRSLHYWYHLYPLVTLAISVCFVECWKRAHAASSDSWVRALCKGIVAAIALVGIRQAITTGVSQYGYLSTRAAEGRRLRAEFDKRVLGAGPIVIWGRLADTQTYGDLQRMPASRYLTADALKAIWHEKSDKYLVSQEKFTADFLNDVRETPPVAILDLSQRPLTAGNKLQALETFAGLRDWLQDFESQPFEFIPRREALRPTKNGVVKTI